MTSLELGLRLATAPSPEKFYLVMARDRGAARRSVSVGVYAGGCPFQPKALEDDRSVPATGRLKSHDVRLEALLNEVDQILGSLDGQADRKLRFAPCGC